MFLEKWIEDCSKEELVRRLTSNCELTNQPVDKDDQPCECFAHRVLRVEAAEKRATSKEESRKEASNLAFDLEERLKDLRSERDGLDKRVSELIEAVEGLEGQRLEAVEVAKAAQKEASSAKQAKADVEADYLSAISRYQADSDRLQVVLLTLKELV